VAAPPQPDDDLDSPVGVLVGGRVYFLAFSLAGPDVTPYREVDQQAMSMHDQVPPAGLEPAASGLRARRHRHFDHEGVQCSGGRARTGALAGNNQPVFPTRPRRNGRRGSRTPKGRVGPPVFGTGYRADGSPSESGPGRRRTRTFPVKSRELCQRLSYGAIDM
jgi:hypothetical protein